jgi:hypothetical protein
VADLLDVLELTPVSDMLAPAPLQVAELERMITAVSRCIDEMCGPVVVREITAEQHKGGKATLKLRRRPVTDVTLVREVTSPGSIATLSATTWGAATSGYHAPVSPRNPDLLSGFLHRKESGCDKLWRDAEVTYDAGRYADTASVDARFAEAALEVIRRLWRRETGVWLEDTSIYEESLDPQQTGSTSGFRSGFFRAVQPILTELLPDELDRGPWVA